jgi:hypothetical protein
MSESSVLVLVLVLVERRDMVGLVVGERRRSGSVVWLARPCSGTPSPQGFCSWSRRERFDMRSPVHGTDGPRLR